MEPQRLARWRIFVVAILGITWAAFALPNLLFENFVPRVGCFGFQTGYDNTITAVDCAAERAGVIPGDRILYDRLPLDQRYNASRPGWAGTTVTFPFDRHSRLRLTPLTADIETFPAGYTYAVVVRKAAQIFFILFAATVLLQRPSRMTWGLYLYALGMFMVNIYAYSFLPAIPYYALQFMSYMFFGAGEVGLLVFGLRFPNDRADGRRSRIEALMPYAFALVGVYIASVYAADMTGAIGSQATIWFEFLPSVFFYACALAAIFSYYVQARGNERIRTRWAMSGVLGGSALYVFGLTTWPLQWFPAVPWELFSAAATAFIAIALAYAIVRHRVFDIGFVANRALVFFIIAAVAAGVLAGIETFIADAVPYGLHVAATVAAAFGLGYATAKSYGLLVTLVDRAMFPRRYRTAVRLHELRLAVEAQNDRSEIMRMLIGGVCKALGLASAAVFRASPDGGFIREYAVGWPSGSMWHLLSTDRIVRNTPPTVDKPLRVRDQWPLGVVVPQGFARPILCCAIGNHGRRAALFLYSAHTDGSEIDRDEARGLMKLCKVYGREALT